MIVVLIDICLGIIDCLMLFPMLLVLSSLNVDRALRSVSQEFGLRRNSSGPVRHPD